jgi:predicted DNA-binding transcriptional regulator AlpA
MPFATSIGSLVDPLGTADESLVEPHEQQEVETVLRRFADLTSRAQVEAFALIRGLLDGDVQETATDVDMARRKGALSAIGRVAEELGLPEGQAPTTTQFREVSKRLGLGWSVSKVGRAWSGKWRFACEAYVGHRLRRSARQQGVLDAQGKRRVYEDYVTSLRLWLDTNPLVETTVAYDRWSREFNEVLPRNQAPVSGWTTIYHNLRVSFRDVLRVARGEVALADCPKKAGGDHTKEHGPLASRQWIAGEYGLSAHQAANVPRHPDFPKPVVLFSGRRAWLRDDVRAYFEGRRVPKRTEFELQDQYLGLAELAALMGKPPSRLKSQTMKRPPQAGLVSRTRYWERREVERWMQGAPAPNR